MSQNNRVFQSQLLPTGYRTQSGVGTQSIKSTSVAVGPISGMVAKVYYVDQRQQEFPAEAVAQGNRNPSGQTRGQPQRDAHYMVIDVVTYSSASDIGYEFIPRVPVCFGYASLQDGDLMVPREMTMSLTGSSLTALLKNYLPHEVDCDHCLVEFLASDPTRPFVRTFFRPLAADVGTQDRPGARVTNLKAAEGRPRLMKWAGATVGVDTKGNVLVDLQRSHGQDWDAKAREPRLETDPSDTGDNLVPTDGSSGNLDIRLRAGSRGQITISPDPNTTGNETILKVDAGTLSLVIAGGPTVDITLNGADSQVVIGGVSSVHTLPRYQELMALYIDLKIKLDALDKSMSKYALANQVHVHGLPGTPPVLPIGTLGPVAAADWNAGIESPTFKIP